MKSSIIIAGGLCFLVTSAAEPASTGIQPSPPGGQPRLTLSNSLPAWLARNVDDFPARPGEGRAAVPRVTSLANPDVHFTLPETAYVVLRRAEVEAVVVDNRAVDDAVLPRHAAGYHGIAAIRHVRQPRNLFVPTYAGLNFEHIHDGTVQSREVLFEPRQAPMELRIIDEHTAELYQRPTPYWGLESCMRYELLSDGVIELTFECIPRRDAFRNGYLGLFWASYIDQPESLDIFFRGVPDSADGQPDWQRGVTPAHGTFATHRSKDDDREFAHDPAFPLELPFGFSRLSYAEPWYFGICRGMAFIQIFRPENRVWLTQSPSNCIAITCSGPTPMYKVRKLRAIGAPSGGSRRRCAPFLAKLN